jgi:phytoene dehydrogenase-like protein
MKGRTTGKEVLIVGAGMAGLTAAAYLSRAGHRVTILEKSGQIGGLVHTFSREGFHFDTGPRAIGNAGIVKPMAEDLGLDIAFGESPVSTGIADKIVHYRSLEDIDSFIQSLRELFPDSLPEIERLSRRLWSFSRQAAALNRVANPYFKNLLRDARYLFTELIPWLPSFLSILMKTAGSKRSVEGELAAISRDQSLNDMVCQHFFKGTPREFALGYFYNFLDYLYPKGGTGRLPEALRELSVANGARILLDAAVTAVDPVKKSLRDEQGRELRYDALLWAADLRTLYEACETGRLPKKDRRRVLARKEALSHYACAESVFSLFVAVGAPPEDFARVSRGHFIYTPETHGLGELHRSTLADLKKDFDTLAPETLWSWLAEFCRYNSYEISIPVLKDRSLAPEGKTGLIVSLMFDGELCMQIHERGWYGEFKERTANHMLDALEGSVYPGLRSKILFTDTATPHTLRRMFGVRDGAIIGWSLEGPAPVPDRLTRIGASVRTPIPGVFTAGQWTYSPAGVPVAILTGRIAAQAINSRL